MIDKAITYWAQLQPYRTERYRCKNYTYGNQWKDIVTVEGGRRIPEEQYIREQGSAPLKNNLIRKIVRNVLGVFRNNYQLPKYSDLRLPHEILSKYCVSPARMEELFEKTVRENSMVEIYSRVLEEYLIGGMAVVRKRLQTRPVAGVFTHIVKPDSFFFNTDACDPRGWDIRTIGEIHTLKANQARSAFPQLEEKETRIFEIWQMENGEWNYYFIDENGKILQQGASPIPGGGHPYIVKAYPFIDGEIHSFVADCIDQQRYINRLITLNDWIIRSSAKGVLLFPESAIPEDLELDDIADQWSRYNGVIRYRAKTGMPLPQQVSSNATNIGVSELLEVQLKMMEDVSGINAALQGQLSSGNISGSLYEQQTRQALTGLADIMEGFRTFMTESALLDIRLLSLIG